MNPENIPELGLESEDGSFAFWIRQSKYEAHTSGFFMLDAVIIHLQIVMRFDPVGDVDTLALKAILEIGAGPDVSCGRTSRTGCEVTRGVR